MLLCFKMDEFHRQLELMALVNILRPRDLESLRYCDAQQRFDMVACLLLK